MKHVEQPVYDREELRDKTFPELPKRYWIKFYSRVFILYGNESIDPIASFHSKIK